MSRIGASHTVGEMLHLLRFRAQEQGKLPRRSRDTLAELADVSGGTVSNYERGGKRSWDEMLRIVEVLAELLGEDARQIIAEVMELDRLEQYRKPAEIEAQALVAGGEAEAETDEGEDEE